MDIRYFAESLKFPPKAGHKKEMQRDLASLEVPRYGHSTTGRAGRHAGPRPIGGIVSRIDYSSHALSAGGVRRAGVDSGDPPLDKSVVNPFPDQARTRVTSVSFRTLMVRMNGAFMGAPEDPPTLPMRTHLECRSAKRISGFLPNYGAICTRCRPREFELTSSERVVVPAHRGRGFWGLFDFPSGPSRNAH